MKNGIWVFIEYKMGKLLRVSREILSEAGMIARKMEKSLIAVVFGYHVDKLKEAIVNYDVSKICFMNNQDLEFYCREAYTYVMQSLIVKYCPEVIFFGNTSMGLELANSLAARLGIGVITGCSRIELNNDDRLIMSKPVYGGKFELAMMTSGRPQMATILPGYFEIKENEKQSNPEIIKEVVDIDKNIMVTKVLEVTKGDPKKLDLSEAEIIVAGGKGVGSYEDFKLIYELADTLGRGSAGGSRVAVDKGWIPLTKQIGQTGKTVSSELFMAFGISGAIQFLMGMKDSRIVIANDINPNAPILKIADIGIIGDLKQIIPSLIEEIKNHRLLQKENS